MQAKIAKFYIFLIKALPIIKKLAFSRKNLTNRSFLLKILK